MEGNNIEEKITVQMTADALFDFTLYHTYSKFSGFLTNILGLAVIFMGIIMFVTGDIKGLHLIIYIAAGIAFISYTPLLIKYRAKKQVISMDMFKNTNEYVFHETGITVTQSDIEHFYGWDMIKKVVATPKTIGIYYGTDEALIIPKESFGNQFIPIIRIMESHVKPQNIKIK